MLKAHVFCERVRAGERLVTFWSSTREGLFTGVRPDVGYKSEAGCLCKATTTASSPFACVVRFVDADV